MHDNKIILLLDLNITIINIIDTNTYLNIIWIVWVNKQVFNKIN